MLFRTFIYIFQSRLKSTIQITLLSILAVPKSDLASLFFKYKYKYNI